MPHLPRFSDAEILALRPAKNAVDPQRPYAYLVENERSATGKVEEVATIFLTNRECPFRCLMCDLWKNTTDEPVPPGAIPDQIRYALAQLPPARHLKLYNSGNFFDRQAIPQADYGQIATLANRFQTLIVENHPQLCHENCLRFRDQLDIQLEIALGLETTHQDILARLNKRMTLDDFRRAAGFLRDSGIQLRTFILLKTPGMSEQEAVEWALRSIDFALDAGARCCAVIPTRSGNGVMEQLESDGHFTPPRLQSIELVLEEAIRCYAQRGRVFMDLWELQRFCRCPHCGPQRRRRLHRMNLTQQVLPAVRCDCD